MRRVDQPRLEFKEGTKYLLTIRSRQVYSVTINIYCVAIIYYVLYSVAINVYCVAINIYCVAII